jgi:argininosuccinate synthase
MPTSAESTTAPGNVPRPSIIDSFRAIEERGVNSCLLLYSGGIDSTYFLDWALSHSMDVVALTVGLENAGEHAQSEQFAGALGASYVFQDRTEEFFADYVAAGIKANAYYQGLYPICSSLSRPLMAKAAVELARERGIEAVAHTSTPTQNSATRFNLSLMALAPELAIVVPYLGTRITRGEKLARLGERALEFDTDVYSIDQNLWGRVIECGTLENPENDLPGSGVFRWSADIRRTPDEPEIVEIGFEEGLPTTLCGERRGLVEIVEELNRVGGKHGIGRFGGLEETTLGVKNHEVREAPAAQILTTAHRELESAVLTQEEMSLKAFLDDRWTNLVVSGRWFSELAEALRSFSERMNGVVEGVVRFRLHKGTLTTLSKKAAAGLYYAGFEEEFYSLAGDFSFPPAYALMGLPSLRRGRPVPATIPSGGGGRP